MDEGAGNSHALLLAAGEFGWAVRGPVAKVNEVQAPECTRSSLIGRHAGQKQGQFHVLQRRHRWDQVELLEDHAYHFASIARLLPARQRGQAPRSDNDLPMGRF